MYFFPPAMCVLSLCCISSDMNLQGMSYSESQRTGLKICVALLVVQLYYAITERCQILDSEQGTFFMQLLELRNSPNTFSCASSEVMTVPFVFTTTCSTLVIPYPTAFPYGNGMVLHFYQQQESSTTKTVHKVINKGLKTYV